MTATRHAPGPVAWFELVIEPDRQRVRVQPVGELDLAAAPQLRASVRELVDAGFDQLIIDLRQLSFIDVAGVRGLLQITQDARREGWQLSLRDGPTAVRRVFALTDTAAALPFARPTPPRRQTRRRGIRPPRA